MAENVNDTNLTMEEYSIQYFGFTPKSFCNGVYNAMNEYLSECIKAVMDFMTIEYADLLSADQIETGISKILAQYSEVFDQNFDRFELYMYKNIFHIPSHVLLPEDEVQTVVRTQSEEESLDDEITILEMKIWAVKIAIARLREELLDLDVSQKQLDSTLAKLNELSNLMAEAGVSHPHEALLATAENIAKCKRLIAKITKDSSLSSPVDTISEADFITEQVGQSRKRSCDS